MKRVAAPQDKHPSYIQESPEGILLTVHVQPNASRSECAGIHGGALKCRVAAPPVDGAANDALCRFLADRFGLPTSAVKLQSGSGRRRKRLLLRGLSASRVLEVLEPAAATRTRT